MKIYNMLFKNMKQVVIKDRRKMGWGMDLANFIIIKEVFIKGIGKIILWMEKEIYIILMEKLLMKDNGEWINFMELAKFIMRIKLVLKDFMITLILQISMIIGHFIKVNLIQIADMVRVKLNYQTVKFLLEILLLMLLKDKGSFIH